MIQNFTDLTAYQKAHQLVLETYQHTNDFPDDEKFCLTNQMRRAGISVTSNIAEGFSRNSSKDKSHFYAIAKGSLTELQSQCMIAKDLHYLNKDQYRTLENKMIETARLISGLIKSALNH